MNPYDATIDKESSIEHELNPVGGLLLSVGFFALFPAAFFSLLVVVGMFFAIADGESLLASHPGALWATGMAVSFITFTVMALKMTSSAARIAMYVLGAATVFCSVLYDTHNVVGLNAYTGDCGNPVAVGLMFRIACFSTYIGVPLVALAGLVGIAGTDPASEDDEPCDSHEGPHKASTN